jgi:hypothetical protein
MENAMLKPIFSEPGYVYIQGPYVLRYINRFETYVEYQVLGFKKKVILRDYRSSGLSAIEHVLAYQDTSHFPDAFNGEAHITIYDLDYDHYLIIELKDSYANPSFLLWIIIGFDGYVPAYAYDYSLVQKCSESEFALIALVNIYENDIDLADYSSSENSALSSLVSCCSSFIGA